MMNTTQRFLHALETTDDPRMLTLLAKDPTIQAELGVRPADVARTGVHCPVIQDEIVAPCILKTCVFYTDTPRCHHCSLVYANNTDMQVEDLAVLYRRPVAEIQAQVNEIVVKLRNSMEAEARFEFVPLTGVCCACESPIEDAAVRAEGYEYCSSACVTALPPAKLRSGYIAIDLPRS